MSDPQERLETYRAKRDFSVTAEPAGAGGRRAGRAGSSSSATGPAASTTTSGSRSTACWSAGPCPRGRRSTPRPGSWRSTSRTTPSSTSTSRASSPRASTAAATSSCGTGARGSRSSTDDPAAAIEKGELHFDLQGEKLAGRFVLVRRDRTPTASGKEQWLLLHKNDEHAEPGWDPEDHPRSVKSGRTNDEVAGRPRRRCGAATCRRPRPSIRLGRRPAARVGPADRRRAGRPRRAGQGRHVGAPGPGAEAHQPRQGALPRPGRRGAGHQARPRSATTPRSPRSCCPTCTTGRST